MSFNYQSVGPQGQTPTSPSSKPMSCKSFKIDLAAVNATTAVTYDLGWLPQSAQIVGAMLAITTATSGPGPVSAATMTVRVNALNLWIAQNVFSTGTSMPNTLGYLGNGLAPTTDQKVDFTLTLTGGTSATAGVIYINLFYVN